MHCSGCEFEETWTEPIKDLMSRIIEQHPGHSHGIPTTNVMPKVLAKEFKEGPEWVEQPEIKHNTIIGKRFDFKTQDATRGNGNPIVARMTDGRVVLFNQRNSLTSHLKPGQKVRCVVTRDEENFVIANPEVILGPTEPLDTGLPEIVED